MDHSLQKAKPRVGQDISFKEKLNLSTRLLSTEHEMDTGAPRRYFYVVVGCVSGSVYLSRSQSGRLV